MAEELTFPDRSDGALIAVYPELMRFQLLRHEFVFQKPRHRVHHPLPRRQ